VRGEFSLKRLSHETITGLNKSSLQAGNFGRARGVEFAGEYFFHSGWQIKKIHNIKVGILANKRSTL
jgi:hypothetical protein